MKAKADKARIAAAEVLCDVFLQDAFSNESLEKNQSISSLRKEERAFATAMVYGCLTYRIPIDFILAKQSDRKLEKIDPLVLIILRMGVWQICYSYAVPKFAAVDESVKLCRYFRRPRSAAFVNAILRRIDPGAITWRTKDKGIELGLGNELFGLFKKWFGDEEAIPIAESFLKNHFDICLRVNRKYTDPERLSRSLASEGAKIKPARYFSHALYLDLGEKRMEEFESFKDGLFMVQEEAAQAVGLVSHAEEKKILLDLCAAPGGKSCDLAERMPPEARLIAIDISERRLDLARENAKRLRLDLDFFVADAADSDFSRRLLASYPFLKNGADLLLVDVPCSGLGLLARKPELRWRVGYEDLKRFPPIQRQLLENAAGLCAKGGEIVYSTCTLNPAENHELVQSFLAGKKGEQFSLLPIKNRLPDSLIADLQANRYTSSLLEENFLLFRPDVSGGDGFFIAVLKKKGD